MKHSKIKSKAEILAEEHLKQEKLALFRLQKEAIGNNRQDLSRPALEQLLEQGYAIVQWDAGSSTHMPCVELNNQQWTLEDFIGNLEHDAPIFEKSHPGDISCSVVVVGEGLPPVRVDSYGNVDGAEGAYIEEPEENVFEEPAPKPKRQRRRKKREPKAPRHGFTPGTQVRLKPEYGYEWEQNQVYEVLPDEDQENVLLMDEEGEIFRIRPEQIERV